MVTQTKQYGKTFRNAAAGLLALVGFASSAFADSSASSVKTSGNMAYYVAGKANSGAPTSYAEVNHSTALPYSTKVSGFVDMYKDGKGYFGKTSVDKSIANGLGAKVQALHCNSPLSQVGVGVTYVLPVKSAFAKLTYLPAWADNTGEKVDNKQIVGLYVAKDLTSKVNLSAFGEVNVAGTKGPQFTYGEIELARKFGDRVSVGANLQLNGKGAGEMTPELVPRVALRVNF